MQVRGYVTTNRPMTVYLYHDTEKDTTVTDMSDELLFLPVFSPEIDLLLKHIETETVWFKYAMGCLKTWNQDYLPYIQVANAALGVVGEFGEVNDLLIDLTSTDLIIDELGDLLYYRTMFCLLMGLDFDLRKTSNDSNNTWKAISYLCDVGKKVPFHEKFHNNKTYQRAMYGITVIDVFIQNTLLIINAKLDDVMQLNLDKLSQRHSKGKFNPNY